mgnify:FL=1
MTNEHKTLSLALLGAQRAIHSVVKESRNRDQGYNYASTEAIIEEAREALLANGLTAERRSLTCQWEDAHEVIGKSGARTCRIGHVAIEFALVHAATGTERVYSMSQCAVSGSGKPEDKALSTANTYALGYWLRDVLMIPRCERDADADQRDDREQYRRAAAPVQRQATPAPRTRAHADDGEVPPEAAQAVEAFAVAGDGAEIEEIAARFRPLLQSWAPTIRGIVANAKKAALARVAAAAEGAVTT